MSVEVEYNDRMGNNMFQYATGRILAEGLGFKLICGPIHGFEATKEIVSGKRYEHPVQVVDGCNSRIGYDYLQEYLDNNSSRKIVVRGHLQKYQYFKRHKKKLRRWFRQPDYYPSISKDDLVIHIRLGDYFEYNVGSSTHCLSQEYYQKVIDLANPREVFVVTEEPYHNFIIEFSKKTGCKVISQSPTKDFAFISSFNKVCMSKSTFSWWAAFLSNAEEVYIPKASHGIWCWEESREAGIDLFVDDESRYINVEC